MANNFALKFAVVFYLSACVFASKTEDNLLKDLLKNYNKLSRPVTNDSDAVQLTLGLTLNQIHDINEEDNKMIADIWMSYSWMDVSLTWDEQNYPIADTRIPITDIWVPDIEIWNHRGENKFGLVKNQAVVQSGGLITWIPSYEVTTSCKIDPTWYPFDEQICSIKFGSWAYNGFKVNLIKQADEVSVSNYVKNEDWSLIKAPCERNEIIYDCCPEPYQDITCKIHLKRESNKYWSKYILPQVCITLICILSGFISVTTPIPRLILKLLMVLLFCMTLPKYLPDNSLMSTLTTTNYIIILISFIFDIILISIQSRLRNDEEKGSNKCLKVLDVTIAIFFLVTLIGSAGINLASIPFL